MNLTTEEQLAASRALAQELTERLGRVRAYVRKQAGERELIVKVRLEVILGLVHGLDEDGKRPPKA